MFLCLYFCIGNTSAFLHLERVSKRSVKPILRLFGAKVGKRCIVQTGLMFNNCSSFKNLTIGDDCFIGRKCFFDLQECIVIRDNVTVAMQTTFITHQDFFSSSLSKAYPSEQKNIVINSHAYIGAKSTILMGVTVEEGSIVGANSLVNKDVAKNTMVGGVPVKLINKQIPT